MIRRLDAAAATGERNEDCAQFYCPPQLPNFFKSKPGDNYSPPPQGEFSDQIGVTLQRVHPTSVDGFAPEPVTLQQLGDIISPAVANVQLVSDESFEANDYFDHDNSDQSSSIDYVNAPKIRTVEYAKVSVQNPTFAEILDESVSPQVAQFERINREKRGFVQPVKLSDLVRNERVLSQPERLSPNEESPSNRRYSLY